MIKTYLSQTLTRPILILLLYGDEGRISRLLTRVIDRAFIYRV